MGDPSPISPSGRNALGVHCVHCPTLILCVGAAAHHPAPHPLPLNSHTKDTKPEEYQQVSSWWMVEDMFTFENIGFSHTVDSRKFLVCANCERGPVGFHDIEGKKSYVALDRVRHGEK